MRHDALRRLRQRLQPARRIRGNCSNVTSRLVLGLCVMGFGVLLWAKQIGWLPDLDVVRLWPAALIALGVAKLTEPPHYWRSLGAYLWIGGGAALLSGRLHLTDIWRLAGPFALLMVGYHLVRSGSGRGARVDADALASASATPLETEGSERLTAFAFLGGVTRKSSSHDFRGGEFTAVMGGVEIDLRDAHMQADEATVDVLAFWGGVELRVPSDWVVVSKGLALLGGFDDNTRAVPGATKRLLVRGTAVMGGVEITNRERK